GEGGGAGEGGVESRCRRTPPACILDRRYLALGAPVRGRVSMEASPSLVYGAALLMRFGLTPVRGSNPRASAIGPVRSWTSLAPKGATNVQDRAAYGVPVSTHPHATRTLSAVLGDYFTERPPGGPRWRWVKLFPRSWTRRALVRRGLSRAYIVICPPRSPATCGSNAPPNPRTSPARCSWASSAAWTPSRVPSRSSALGCSPSPT